MRPVILLCLCVISGNILNAQFTVLPQLGFENSRTSVEFNELSSFAPGCGQLSPQAGVRLDYKFKQLHGPYIGIATSRSIIKFNFSEPATGMDAYTTSRGNTQLRLEGGYQVSTKPIYFKKSRSTNSNLSSKEHSQKSMERKSCGGSMIRSSCGSKAANRTVAAKSNDKGSWVRIQPSLGVAYIPSAPTSEIYTKSQGMQTNYEYNAGNWKTAVTSGVGFEFGNNEKRTFNISINYLKGISNLDAKTINTVSGNKPSNTSLESNASNWNLRMGIPISLTKKKPVVKQQVIEKNYKEEKKCGQYRIQYKSRCSKVI